MDVIKNRFLCTVGVVFLLLLSVLNANKVHAENYRAFAHKLSHFTEDEKGMSMGTALTGTLLGGFNGLVIGTAVVPAIVAASAFGVATMGIGAGAMLTLTGTGVGVYKLKKYLRAKPYYRMARIMNFVKAETDKIRDKDRKAFVEYFESIKHKERWNGNAEEFKAFLVKLSREGYLESYPSPKDLRLSVDTGMLFEHMKHPYENDYGFIIKLYAANKKDLPSSEQVFRKLDLTLHAYKEFFYYRKFRRSYSSATKLVKVGIKKGLYDENEAPREVLEIVQRHYRKLLDNDKVDLSTLNNTDSVFLEFETSIFEAICETLIKDKDLLVEEDSPNDFIYQKTFLIKYANYETFSFDHEQGETCSICLDNLALSTAQCPECKNKFCLDCLYQYHRTNAHAACPLCRHKIEAELKNFSLNKMPLPFSLKKLLLAQAREA